MVSACRTLLADKAASKGRHPGLNRGVFRFPIHCACGTRKNQDEFGVRPNIDNQFR